MTSCIVEFGVPFDARPRVLPPIERLVSAAWSFGTVGGDIHAPFVKLRADGSIGGHSHPKETAWSHRHGSLVFLDDRGLVSTVFDRQVNEGGRLRLLGGRTGAERTGCELVEIVPAHALPGPFRRVELKRRSAAAPRRDLVILRANEASLHRSWPVDIAPADRSWDLCVSFYGRGKPPNDFSEYGSVQREERKFQAIRSLLMCHPSLTAYDYVMFPDDDIQMSWGDINASFHAMRRWRLELGQPSLHPDGVINYEATRQDARYHVRFASMVEVMIPIMSRATLLACLQTFDLTRSSYGIDYAWSKIVGGDPRSIGIIDDVAVMHTRPTGTAYDLQPAYKEGDALSARYGREEWFQVNLRGGITR